VTNLNNQIETGMNVGREVMWLIPLSFKVSMYVMMFVALGYMAWGFWKKYQFVIQGSSLKNLLPSQLNLKSFLETIFFTGKVVRDKRVGFF
jgi:hypothetical protein